MVLEKNANSFPDDDSVSEIQQLINASPGDEDDAARLYKAVEKRFRAIAQRLFRNERVDHTLQPTVLVNDAFGELVQAKYAWINSGQFFAAAAKIMRRKLVDHSKRRQASKRGSGQSPQSLDDNPHCGLANASSHDPQILAAIDETLERFGRKHPDVCQVVDLHVFMGLTLQEIAKVQEVSLGTVKRRWSQAKTLLYDALGVTRE